MPAQLIWNGQLTSPSVAAVRQNGFMFNSVLLPVEGTEFSEAVLPHLLRVIVPATARVHVLAVVPPVPTHIRGDAPDDLVPLMRIAAAQAFAGAQHTASLLAARGVTAHVEVNTGDVAQAIIARAHDIGSDLIAMSTHGRNGLARLLFGGTAERVLQNADLPMLLFRPPAKDDHVVPDAPIRRILVPLDGSSTAEAILPLLRKLGEAQPGLRVNVLRVPDAVTLPQRLNHPGLLDSQRESERKVAEEYVMRVVHDLEAAGICSVAHVVDGSPAQVIGALAHEVEAELILMATHGHSGLSRMLFGTVTQAVINTVDVPVLVLRPRDLSTQPLAPLTGARNIAEVF